MYTNTRNEEGLDSSSSRCHLTNFFYCQGSLPHSWLCFPVCSFFFSLWSLTLPWIVQPIMLRKKERKIIFCCSGFESSRIMYLRNGSFLSVGCEYWTQYVFQIHVRNGRDINCSNCFCFQLNFPQLNYTVCEMNCGLRWANCTAWAALNAGMRLESRVVFLGDTRQWAGKALCSMGSEEQVVIPGGPSGRSSFLVKSRHTW